MVKLEIIVNDNNGITVNGPLTNKILCYGLLTAAQDVIRNFEPKEQSLISVPEFQAPANLRVIEREDDGR